MRNKMEEEGKLGGRRKKQNDQAQAKEHAKKKAAEAGSSSKAKELTFQEIFGIETIRKDWSVNRQITGSVRNQGLKDICWAICFACLLQAIYNIQHPDDQIEFSVSDLVGSIIPDSKEKGKGLALANLKKAFKHISTIGMLKMPTKGHGMVKIRSAGDKGKKVQENFDIYQDVDASFIRQQLDLFPVALRLEIEPLLSDNKGEIYYLPKKEVITPYTRLHCLILIGYGITKEGKWYFIGQNSWGEKWGCK
ncbi:unnamed protein product, partial [Thlaspi arvense]